MIIPTPLNENIMNSVFAQAQNFNPEAIINATIAAKAAELAANQIFYISVGLFLMLLAIGGVIMFMLYKLFELERNTNGMRVALVETTRKLALVEGNVAGRAELTEESKKEKP